MAVINNKARMRITIQNKIIKINKMIFTTLATKKNNLENHSTNGIIMDTIKKHDQANIKDLLKNQNKKLIKTTPTPKRNVISHMEASVPNLVRISITRRNIRIINFDLFIKIKLLANINNFKFF